MSFHSLLLTSACLLLPATIARAEEPPLRDLLRDGLYTEEVTRDPEAAAKQYEQLLTHYAEQRDFAAAALFRLAEVRRKQDRKEDAIQLYQRLLTEFPAAANETKLARENLAAIGGKPAETAPAQGDAESIELARLQAAAKSSPDVLLDPQNMQNAVSNDMPKVVKFLLNAGSRPYDGFALQLAVQKGNLEITRLLLEKGGEVPPELARLVIGSAIDDKRPTILEFLLEKGLRPTATIENPIPPLAQALVLDQYAAAEILLKHGADPDEIVAPNPGDEKSGGTPLHLLLWAGKADAVAWLLEKGAKPDIATPRFGLTPLHLAALSEKAGVLAIMEKLLAAGADPNHLSERDTFNDNNWHPALNATPLESAILAPTLNVEKVELLLKHGGKTDRKDSQAGSRLAMAIRSKEPNVIKLITLLGEAGMSMKLPEIIQAAAKNGDSELVSLVLKYGADPNIHIGPDGSLLAIACKSGDAARIALLLKAGADFNEVIDGKGLIQLAATSLDVEFALPCLKLLLDAGAMPANEWKANGYMNAAAPVRQILLERFTIPELGKDSEINLLVDKDPFLQTLSIATRSRDSKIPELGAWLMDHHREIKQLPSAEDVELVFAIWRKNEGGELIKQDLDFKTTAKLPDLRWGDVVTCAVGRVEAVAPVRSPGGRVPPPRPQRTLDGLPEKLLWHLRKRISFPITVETDGKSREIQVRGDRIFFDPTKDEVPLGSVQQIASHLWQKDLISWELPVTFVVSRKGWPDVRLAYGSKEAWKFQLEPADLLKLEITDEVREQMASLRKRLVTVNVEGYPFARWFGDWHGDITPPTSFPTVIQALVEMQSPLDWAWIGLPEKQILERSDLSASADDGYLLAFTLLPHPDLSRIRIRRLMETGGEGVIEVDLMKAIAAADDAKKADFALQAGDVVEIPLLKERLAEPWKGYSPKENAFFAKALAGQVQIIDSDGNLSVKEIDYYAPLFRETEIGWVPLPTGKGVPSTRATWFGNSSDIEIKRGGVTEKNSSRTTFLRDGDEIRPARAEQPRPPMPRQQQPPPQPVPRTIKPRTAPE